MFSPAEKYPVPSLWWFYLPWLFAALMALAHFQYKRLGMTAAQYQRFFYSEDYLSLVETLQTVLLFAAFMVGARLFFTLKGKNPWLRAWVGIAAVGSLFVFLEEISYGQHLFGWHASDYWKTINDQHETNLHNTSSWLDQKPRLLLEAGVVVGGIIIPLLQRFKPGSLPKKFRIIYPPVFLFWIATLGQYAHFTEEMSDLVKIGFLNKEHYIFPLQAFTRESEIQECYYYYFILLYLMNLRRQIRGTK